MRRSCAARAARAACARPTARAPPPSCAARWLNGWTCRSTGALPGVAVRFMRAVRARQVKLKRVLWLARALPSSLLLLSRAFTVTQPFQTPKPTAAYDSLKETLGALPNKARARAAHAQ